jgi:DNA-binding beta-propeller fold protein YncE
MPVGLMNGSKKARHTPSITNKTSIFGIMGGLSSSIGTSNVAVYRHKQIKGSRGLPQLYGKPINYQQTYLKTNYLLSINPLGSGGVSKKSSMFHKSCNCSQSHSSESLKNESLKNESLKNESLKNECLNYEYNLIASGLSKPISIIYDNNNILYATIDSDNSIYIINPDNTFDTFISGLNLPVVMVFDKNYTNMYVTNFGNDTISIINMSSKQITNTLTNTSLNPQLPLLKSLSQPNGMCFDNTYENLYITNILFGNIVSINLNTNNVTLVDNTITPILVTIDNNNNLFVSSLLPAIIYKYNISTFTTTRSIFSKNILLTLPRVVIWDNNYQYLYVTNSEGIPILRFDQNGILASICENSIFNEPRGICFDNNNNFLLSNYGSGTIYIRT